MGALLTEAAAKLPAFVSRHPLAPLFDPGTIRARCNAILQAVENNVSPHFTVDRNALPRAAERVARLTRERFPDLRIPYHSRWRHFEAGGVDRKALLDARLEGCGAAEAARVRIDLTVVSVLLDAGAGGGWRYVDGDEGSASYSRSEGLGVASFNAFMQGSFSDDPAAPLRADAALLERMDVALLRPLFQAGPTNTMVGLEGRAGLLERLGAALRTETASTDLPARPGLLYDRITASGTRRSVSATEILDQVLRLLGPIWTSGSRVQSLLAGDVWPHAWAGASVGPAAAAVIGADTDPTTGGWVPFHKLSQWLTYSLLEPLQWAGVEVTGVEALTGLPEYRNGGLLLDSGVIVPRNPRSMARTWKPQDEFIVEWRALTVALLDELALQVRQQLGDKTAAELPLACILEGGTWAAGREIARELRADGVPPLRIDSDGTVF
ncbi:MAG: URC4/urg3 family protein [Pseudomonadota bacterium]|nr:URC4/urg3 family protein [Pseudomonadota bacterium]